MPAPNLIKQAVPMIFDTAIAASTALHTAITGDKDDEHWLRFTLVLSAARAVNVVITDPETDTGPTEKRAPYAEGALVTAVTFDFPAPFSGSNGSTTPLPGLTYHLEYVGAAANVDFLKVELIRGGP